MELPLLQRREIEARILAPVIESLAAEFGREAVLARVEKTIEQLATEAGRELAASIGGNGTAELRESLKVWMAGGALEIDVLREDAEHLDFDVTRCRYAEMYRRLGLEELGPILSCNRDFCLAKGFNPDMTLERTQTIMQGAPHCDFRFTCPAPEEA